MEVVCELLPIINTFNVFVCTKNKENVRNVEILETSIKLLGDDSKEFTLKLSNGLRLKKSIECKIQSEENWLCFRAQLEHKTKLISSILQDIVREVPSLVVNSQHFSDKVNIPMQLRCKCGFSISEFKVYRKICALPIADWDHVSEDWFCHLHGDQKDFVKKKGFYPQEDDIYYNELIFNVNINNMQFEANGDVVQCKCCSSEIGLQKGENLKLWTNDVLWADEQNIIYERKPKEIIYSLLQGLEKESLGSSPRLVLESIGSKEELLYIIMMDNHLNLFVTDDSPLSNFEIEESALKKQRLDEDNCYSLKKLKCIKVLFKHKMELDDESGLWIDDINVNVIQCGSSLFKSVLHLLEHSNSCIPDSIRMINDLKVGYILK